MEDGGYHMNSADHTMVGWVAAESDREHWVPDTVVELSRADFITRQQAIHAVTPFTKLADGADENDPEAETVNMTNDEVAAEAGSWWDSFTASH
jgi:hypothetical protein